MYHPTRGGVRGGRDQFSWDQVKSDKDRECYLGHSLMAPVGRWQQGKDLTWYAKDGEPSTSKIENKVNEEFEKARKLEEEALMAALGFKIINKEPPKPKQTNGVPEPPVKSAPSHENTYSVGSASKLIQFDDKKAVDFFLMNLIRKHGLEALIDALGGSKEDLKSSSKKKKSKKKSSKSKRKDDSSSSSSSSASSNESSDSERDAKKSKKHKKDN